MQQFITAVEDVVDSLPTFGQFGFLIIAWVFACIGIGSVLSMAFFFGSIGWRGFNWVVAWLAMFFS